MPATSDIDGRKRAEEEVRETERRFETLVANLPGMVYRCRNDRDWTTEFVSEGCSELTGYGADEFTSARVHLGQLIHPDDRDAVWNEVQAAVRERRSYRLTYRLLTKGGEVKWLWEQGCGVFDAAGDLQQLEGFVTDVTDRRRTEEERREAELKLQQAQKMEAIGRLAGGIAHDFNNILTAILGYGQFLLDAHPPGDPLHTDTAEVMRAAERAVGLTRQLLAFSRRQVLELRILDLNDTIANVTRLLHRVIGEDVDVAIVAGRQLWRVTADPGQIEQVLMNLCVNARDAMPSGGRLTIETANVTLDERAACIHPVMAPGAYVRLTVTDTGVGMSPEVRARVFEPFFTTKESGRGTGLGLATVYGIVKQSNGFIWCYSEPGRGTTFEIFLPRVDADVEPVAAPMAEPDFAGRGETVLLVEDDAAVRALARDLLSQKGYVVLTATDGADALVAASRLDAPIDLLVTDVVMPGMSGGELAERLTARQPETRVLYISGYSDDAIGRRGALDRGARFLQKPFTAATLLGRVREALDGALAVRRA